MNTNVEGGRGESAGKYRKIGFLSSFFRNKLLAPIIHFVSMDRGRFDSKSPKVNHSLNLQYSNNFIASVKRIILLVQGDMGPVFQGDMEKRKNRATVKILDSDK